MLFDFKKFQLIVRRPILLIGASKHELVFRLQQPIKQASFVMPTGYRTRAYTESDNSEIVHLLNSCGFPFAIRQLNEAISICIPGGVHLIEHCNTGNLVAMMMSRHLSAENLLFGGRIDWLATSPEHRYKGLAKIAAKLATNHLIKSGYENIWVTTQPHRLAAIKVFISIGYYPTPQTLSTKNWQVVQARLLE